MFHKSIFHNLLPEYTIDTMLSAAVLANITL
jgi:hypothetical protein